MTSIPLYVVTLFDGKYTRAWLSTDPKTRAGVHSSADGKFVYTVRHALLGEATLRVDGEGYLEVAPAALDQGGHSNP